MHAARAVCGVLGAHQRSRTCACQQVIGIVERPNTQSLGYGDLDGFAACLDLAQFTNLTARQHLVPETQVGNLDRVLFAVLVGKEEGAGANLPVQLVGRCALADDVAVNVELRLVVAYGKDDTVPSRRGNHAVVAKVGSALTYGAVIDEETGVLRVREVVLEERGVAADLRQMDVHAPSVG